MAKEVANNLVILLDRFGKYFFYTITTALYLCVLLFPEYAFGDSSYLVRYFITYTVGSIFANYYLCVKQGQYKPLLQEKETLPGASWTFCDDCQHMQPPRCHHCPLCNRCILKRDHHCFFIASCVGQDNQAQFAVYCYHATIGLFIAFLVLSNYLSAIYYEVFSLDFYHYIPPVTIFNFIMGRIDLSTVFYAILLCGSCGTGISTLALFCWQMFLIASDLTTHDWKQLWNFSVSKWYKVPSRVWYNIKQSFGTFPLLLFIVPIPRSKLLNANKISDLKAYL